MRSNYIEHRSPYTAEKKVLQCFAGRVPMCKRSHQKSMGVILQKVVNSTWTKKTKNEVHFSNEIDTRGIEKPYSGAGRA